MLGQSLRVLVLGSKLSAVDATLILCRHGHNVTLTSPSGDLPAVRTSIVESPDGVVDFAEVAALDYQASDIEQKISDLVVRTIAKLSPLPLSAQTSETCDVLQRLREETTLAGAEYTSWQYALNALADAFNYALIPQDGGLRDRLLRRYRALLSRYLSAMPLQNARKLLRYIDANCLELHAGDLAKVTRKEKQWLVTWKTGESLAFDAIVCATGNQLPVYHATSDTLSFVSDLKQPVMNPELTSGLMVKLPGIAQCERIWLIGVAAHLRVPLVNALYIAVRHADEVSRRIAELRHPVDTW